MIREFGDNLPGIERLEQRALFSANVLVLIAPSTSRAYISERASDGTEVARLTVPDNPTYNLTFKEPRDFYVNSDGRLDLFNGTYNPVVDTYVNGTWATHTMEGWSVVNRIPNSGIVSIGDTVFTTDQATASGGDVTSSGAEAHGLIRFDPDGTATRFPQDNQYSDLAVSPQGQLYALSYNGDVVDVFDPLTMSRSKRITLPVLLGSIAVDAENRIFGGSFYGTLYRLGSDGALQKQVAVNMSVTDMDCDNATGRIVVGSFSNRWGITDSNLSSIQTFVPPKELFSTGYPSTMYVAFGNLPQAATGGVSGIVFNDSDRNGQYGISKDGTVPGITIYADLNDSGTLDEGEPSGVSGLNGSYLISGLSAPGTYKIRQVLAPGVTQAFPVTPANTVSASVRDITFAKHFGMVDSAPPVLVNKWLDVDAPKTAIRFSFSEHVYADAITVKNVDQNLTLYSSWTTTTYDVSTFTESLTFTSYWPTLPDGNYRATIPRTSVTDAARNSPASDVQLDFFFFTADANHDRTVNTLDFNALAANFNKTNGVTFSSGDFNYDGRVNALDFNAIATRFGTYLAPASAPLPAQLPLAVSQNSPRLFADARIDQGDDLLE